MPYVQGESLKDRLNRERQLPIEDALRIAAEVADALGFAHQHNVVHRDIKPENILLEGKHAVVADFGVARAIEEAEETRLTETGIAIGTPAYLSPEQAAGERELDGRSDIYALGCVMYEMLAGQPPFIGPTVESVVHQHLAAEPQSVTAIRSTVPSEVETAVSKALAKSPADRVLVDELPASKSTRMIRAYIAAHRGDTAQAFTDIEWFEAQASHDARAEPTWYHRGVIHGALGNYERAIELLREADRNGDIGNFETLQTDMEFAPLRGHPEFQELVRLKG